MNVLRKKREKLTFIDIQKFVNEAVQCFSSIENVVFTGGEPFLLHEELLKSVSYLKSLQKNVRIVSNAYWAKNYRTAYELLSLYKEAGLTEINYSTGDDHLQYVPFDNIVYATRAALDLNFPVAINIEYNYCKKFGIATLLNDVRLIKYKNRKNFIVNNGFWIPNKSQAEYWDYHKEREKIKEKERIQGCDSIFLNITLSPDKTLFSCCGFAAKKNRYLQMGKFVSGHLKEYYEQQFDDLLKIWLFTSGPLAIAKFVNMYSPDKK